METKNAYDDLITYYTSFYNRILSDSLMRELNTFSGNGNPCSEIELPKEKKSEKPKFNQTKK